jgi:GTP-binding protein
MSETQKKYTVQFVQSAAHFKELPRLAGEEYAVLGRSNVGKSTFINHALASGALARVSKRPGKTTLANLYRLEEGLFWVDLPGYGYAKASIAEKDRWGKLIADYCQKRESLAGIIWLLDIRHPGVGVDMEADEWLREVGKPVLPVLTKGDKISRAAQKKQIAEFRDVFGFTETPIVYSALEHGSRGRFWSGFDAWRSTVIKNGGVRL